MDTNTLNDGSMAGTPSSTLDPYADEALLDPWPLYDELREMGPAVWLKNVAVRGRHTARPRTRVVTALTSDPWVCTAAQVHAADGSS